jgi:adenosylhomocysteine nucleosidase
MKILTMVPIQPEIDFLLQACAEKGFHTRTSMIGKLPVVHLPELDVTLACGGLGKVQFAVQTQHLLDVCPGWDLVICAGAAGALVDGLSVGDVVVATETVEHDIHNKFGKPLLPKFSGAEAVVSALRSVLPLSSSFQVHFGPIASGDEDVVDTDRRRMLHGRTGALAVAWEGAGGARACHFSGVSFVEIRGITDRADSDAASDFEGNLGSAIANVATLITSWLHKRVAS